LQDIFDQSDMGVYVTGLGSLFACHFTKGKPVKDFRAASLKDVEASKEFHLHLVVNGIYCYSPQMVRGCISYAHTEEDMDTFLGVTEDFAKSYSRSK